ncbi:MAG: SusC/RagA family TonB-linked outer membrane protein, partial [Tunicatimonas sp.]|uniref:SusC/RagA family TonB-linked outer membrane protein n=1 Tax=Tunicatimonas sp. TaxID=1940096 RepID=UPI003C783D01
MRLIFYAWIVGILFLVPNFLQAQTTVSGTVTDENGEELVGVSILQKGTTNGTISEIDGSYRVNVSGDNPSMVYSFIGYTTQEVAVNNRSQLDVMLREDVAQLQEIVVVGYGTQKRVNLSGAVDQIDSEVLESRPISNTAQGLQGAIPNLNIDFLSGEPGAAANINIRGLTSINGGNPLILIDGVPSDPVELNRVAPQDISEISVIKDASAAAIYGARAAFGVILITTKSGNQEGVNFSYSNNFSWNTPTVLPRKVTDPYIYLRVRETSTNNTPWDNQNYSDQMYQYARERSNDPNIAPVRINPTDDSQWEYMGDQNWIDHFLSEYTVSQDHALSINGSTDKVGYFISGAYNRQNGVLNVAEDFFDRFSFRSKVDYRPTDWLTIGNNTFLTNTIRENPSALAPLARIGGRDITRSSMTDVYDLHPTDWNVNPDGTWANTDAGRLEARLRDGGRTTDKYNSLQSRFTAQASLWQDLFRLNTDFTYRRGATNFNYHTTRYNIGYGPEDVREEGSNYAYRSTTFDDYTVFNIYGTFNKQLGRHQLTAIAGFNQEYFRSEWFSAARSNVISSSLPTVGLATGETTVDEDIFDWAIRGYFYRLNYIFDDKYILEFNGRYDGTSRFPDGNRYGFFPSASAAWRVDQESFMQPLEDVWSTFKLRASYGSLGNQAVGPYDYIATMSASPSNYLIGGVRPQRVTPPGLVSPNYTWEEVSTLNFGADLGFFGDRLMASFDIYERNTTGMLTLGRELPGVLG